MSPNERIFLSPPHMSGQERDEVEAVFKSNWIAPLGPAVDAFENQVKQYAGVNGGLALSSGTAALHLALRLIGLKAGDTVYCSSLTFVGSVNPIIYEGGTPVFLDSEPSCWNLSPAALERALKADAVTKTLPKAVIAVNLYGQSCDMDRIEALCAEFKVPLIEDAAESLGATYKLRKSGSFGRYSIFSFNGNKIITTSGGGMLLSNCEADIEKARFWSTQSRDKAMHYEHSEIGFNYRLSNVLAAIGCAQMRVLEERVNQRRAVFARYKEALGSIKGVSFMPEADFGRGNRWLTVMTLNPELLSVKPELVMLNLSAQNIEARPVWKPMHRQPIFQGMKYYEHEAGFSFSDLAFSTGICLPSGSALSETDQARVIASVKQTLGAL